VLSVCEKKDAYAYKEQYPGASQRADYRQAFLPFMG
jgi:hypothetical protein